MFLMCGYKTITEEPNSHMSKDCSYIFLIDENYWLHTNEKLFIIGTLYLLILE